MCLLRECQGRDPGKPNNLAGRLSGYLLVSVLLGELLRAPVFITDPGIQGVSRSSSMTLIQVAISFER